MLVGISVHSSAQLQVHILPVVAAFAKAGREELLRLPPQPPPEPPVSCLRKT